MSAFASDSRFDETETLRLTLRLLHLRSPSSLLGIGGGDHHTEMRNARATPSVDLADRSGDERALLPRFPTWARRLGEGTGNTVSMRLPGAV